MELEGSLPWSQQAAADPFPEQDKFSLQHSIPFRLSLILFSHLLVDSLQSFLSFWFPHKNIVNTYFLFSSLPVLAVFLRAV
jgi:hypothetical protein